MSMTTSSEALQCVSWIFYPVQFKESQAGEFKALLDSGNTVNIMNPIFAAKLGLSIRKISISAQKLNGFVLKIYGMTITRFLI